MMLITLKMFMVMTVFVKCAKGKRTKTRRKEKKSYVVILFMA